MNLADPVYLEILTKVIGDQVAQFNSRYVLINTNNQMILHSEKTDMKSEDGILEIEFGDPLSE